VQKQNFAVQYIQCYLTDRSVSTFPLLQITVFMSITPCQLVDRYQHLEECTLYVFWPEGIGTN